MSAFHPRLQSRDLVLVVTIADHGSLRRAALASGQTVASLSKQLRLLEERLATPLFLRSAAGVQPTPAGLTLVEAGRRILADIEAALAAISPKPKEPVPVVIGAGPFIAPFIARDLAPLARTRWPAARLEVQVGYPKDLVAGVRDGRLDFAVCHLDDISVPPGLDRRVVQRLRPVCLVGAQHPLLARAAAGPLPGAALAGLAIAGSHVPERNRAWMTKMIGAPPPVGFVSSDYDLVGEVLTGSDMFTMVPQSLADWMCAHHALSRLDVAMPPYVHTVYAVERAGARLADTTRAIRDQLLALLARDEAVGTDPLVST